MKKTLEREDSSERSRLWTEEEEAILKGREVTVSVIYYLSRNGQLEHPHLMEVPLSSSHGVLCLKDVTDRLNFLRGQGMADSYSWSAKRSYKKGYVWQDLSENDFIYPCNGHDEYILKGTQLIEVSSSSFRSNEAVTSPPNSKDSYETNSSCTDTDSPGTIKKKMMMMMMMNKKKEPWKLGSANASTQTDEEQEDEREVEEENNNGGDGEAALPVSASSGYNQSSSANNIREYSRIMENEYQSGRIKASTVLMQLIRCVSNRKLQDCEYGKDNTDKAA